MYGLNLCGFLVCIVALIASNCEANFRGSRECRDIVAPVYCRRIKKLKFCSIPHYQKRCKMTCDVCTQCRDSGTPAFCNSIKSACENNQRGVAHISKYCKKTCGLCYVPQKPKKKISCVDRPICRKLTLIYKILDCNALTNPRLKRRAFRKCPKFCGVCRPKENEAKVSQPTEQAPKVIINGSPQTVKTSTKKRPPHPPIETVERDDEPRRGVFYIYTKFLSL